MLVLLTGNTAPAALYQNGLQRVRFEPYIDWLQASYQLVEVRAAHDFRRLRSDPGETYLSPLDAQTRTLLETHFLHFSRGEEGQPDRLAVGQRRLVVPRAKPPVSWFHFAELCGQPRGSEDFATLLDAYPVLVLAEVPLLGPNRHDEALRFQTLIDVAYDQKALVIMSAAGPPDRLFAGQTNLSFASDPTGDAQRRVSAGGARTAPALGAGLRQQREGHTETAAQSPLAHARQCRIGTAQTLIEARPAQMPASRSRCRNISQRATSPRPLTLVGEASRRGDQYCSVTGSGRPLRLRRSSRKHAALILAPGNRRAALRRDERLLPNNAVEYCSTTTTTSPRPMCPTTLKESTIEQIDRMRHSAADAAERQM